MVFGERGGGEGGGGGGGEENEEVELGRLQGGRQLLHAGASGQQCGTGNNRAKAMASNENERGALVKVLV